MADVPQEQINKLHCSFFDWFPQYKFLKTKLTTIANLNRNTEVLRKQESYYSGIFLIYNNDRVTKDLSVIRTPFGSVARRDKKKRGPRVRIGFTFEVQNHFCHFVLK